MNVAVTASARDRDVPCLMPLRLAEVNMCFPQKIDGSEADSNHKSRIIVVRRWTSTMSSDDEVRKAEAFETFSRSHELAATVTIISKKWKESIYLLSARTHNAFR